MLDVGCSTGDFIFSAKKSFNVWGQDISEYAINNIISHSPDLSSRLSACTIENSQYEDDFFDIITLWDVIEHIWDPNKVIEMLTLKLKPGGLLFISTPNIGALVAKLMQKRWAFMTPPEHLCFFNRDTLNILFKNNDLKMNNWISQGKCVNLGFLLYKFNRIFPSIIPEHMITTVQKSFLGHAVIYIPTGDIQYTCAKALK